MTKLRLPRTEEIVTQNPGGCAGLAGFLVFARGWLRQVLVRQAPHGIAKVRVLCAVNLLRVDPAFELSGRCGSDKTILQ